MDKPREDEVSKHDGGFLNLNRVAKRRPKHSWRTWLIGNPLPSADAPHQTLSKATGLAVFAGDALSSIAYAPPEILLVLAAAGTAAFSYAFPIAIAVTILLAIVTISYQQTIYARSEEHTSELQSLAYLVCRLLLEKKKKKHI